jgi:5-methylcytosine-specific restriction endonuclease McrA
VLKHGAAVGLERAIPGYAGRGDLKGSLTVRCSGARERECGRHPGMARAPTEHGVRRTKSYQRKDMKKQSIKTHLKPYSIFQKRKTTINHAFASALAPNDEYNEQVLNDALRLLGQKPEDELMCVYCGGEAETWDHLIGLVKDSQLRGYGHQIGNLIPCCGKCNSKKGSRDWQQFIESEIRDEENREQLKAQLGIYLQQYAKPVDLEKIKTSMPEEWAKYAELKEHIFELMKEADKIAEKIRKGIG